VFPLSHKSGVNFKGIYNERITLETNNDVEMESEEVKEKALGDDIAKQSSDKLSYLFFKNFWLLQKYIANPFQVWLP